MNKKLAAALACVTAFTCFTACGDSDGGSDAGDPEDVLESFYLLCTDSDNAEEWVGSLYPEVCIEEFKDQDIYDKILKNAKKTIKNYDFEEVEIVKIKELDEFSEKELKYAQSYFHDSTTVKLEVEEGYEYSVKYKVTNSNDKTKTKTDELCVVKIEDDGWFLIPSNIDELTEEYKSYKIVEKDDDDDDDDEDETKSTKKKSKKSSNDDDDDDWED